MDDFIRKVDPKTGEILRIPVNQGQQASATPAPPPAALTDAQLEAMTKPELIALVKRIGGATGHIALMTETEIAEAMMLKLAVNGLQSADSRDALASMREWLGRSDIDKPPDEKVKSLKVSDKEIIDQYMQQYLEDRNELQITT